VINVCLHLESSLILESMRKFLPGLAVFATFAAVGFLSVLQNSPNSLRAGDEKSAEVRAPSSFSDVSLAIDQMTRDISNSRIFNTSTAANYINGLADQAYQMNSWEFIPSSESDTRDFLDRAESMVNRMFQIRIELTNRLEAFEKSESWTESQRAEVITAFRRAHLYLRYAEDYATQWLHRLKPLKNSSVFFQGEGVLSLPSTPQNKNADSANGFKYRPGDVILVRGNSFFSATIARIGDMPTNMSHIAMVAEASDGKLHVVEALLEKGMVSYLLEDYLKFEPLPRAAIYRLQDPALAQKAGVELWKLYQENLKAPVPFDILMNPTDHSKIYCAEAMSMVIERASGGQVIIPRYQTTFSKSLKTEFFQSMGITAAQSFAPADIDVDTRFRLVREHRDLSLLDESRRYDVVVSRLFEMFQDGFMYRPDVSAKFDAVKAVFARSFGFLKDQVPADASVATMAGLIRHKNLVVALMKDLATAESEAVAKTGRPLSYRELESLFNELCAGRCVDGRGAKIGANLERTGAARCESLFRSTF